MCTSGGTFGSCSCGGSATSPAGPGSGSATVRKCTLDALNCASFAPKGRVGLKLHELVFEARNAKRYAEAICLAQYSTNSADTFLAGASYFETAKSWDGLGCVAEAITAIQQSVRVRPHGRSGWKETCDYCRELGSPCGTACLEADPRGVADEYRTITNQWECCCKGKASPNGDLRSKKAECVKDGGTCVLPWTDDCKQFLVYQHAAEERLKADMKCSSGDRKDCDGDGFRFGDDKDDNNPKVH